MKKKFKGYTVVLLALSFSACVQTKTVIPDETPSTDAFTPAFTPALENLPAKIVEHLGFDEITDNQDWSPGSEIIYQIELDDGTDTKIWHTVLQSSAKTNEPYSVSFKVPDRNRMDFTTRTLTAALQVWHNGDKRKSASVVVPYDFLEKSIVPACKVVPESIDEGSVSAVVEGLVSLVAYSQLIQQTPTLRPILTEVLELPPVWRMLISGVEIAVCPNFSDYKPEEIMLGRTSFSACTFPLTVTVNDEEALLCRLTVIEPKSPFNLCAGIIQVVATSPNNPKKEFRLKLISARRGSLDRNAETTYP